MGFPRIVEGFSWAATGLVGGQVLVGDRANHIDAAVPPSQVVEVVAPGQHDRPRMVGITELVARQDLPFQAGEERLRGSSRSTIRLCPCGVVGFRGILDA